MSLITRKQAGLLGFSQQPERLDCYLQVCGASHLIIIFNGHSPLGLDVTNGGIGYSNNCGMIVNAEDCTFEAIKKTCRMISADV